MSSYNPYSTDIYDQHLQDCNLIADGKYKPQYIGFYGLV